VKSQGIFKYCLSGNPIQDLPTVLTNIDFILFNNNNKNNDTGNNNNNNYIIKFNFKDDHESQFC